MNKKYFNRSLCIFIVPLFISVAIGCFNGSSSSSNNAATDPNNGNNSQASLTIDKENVTTASNASTIITATAKKADATDDTITATSSDTAVAMVSVSGLVATVTGSKAGNTTITITSGSGLSKSCSVTLHASWHTVFEDTFNRADTAANSLSSLYWTLFANDGSVSTIPGNLSIQTNTAKLSAIQQNKGIGAYYNSVCNNLKLRVSCTIDFAGNALALYQFIGFLGRLQDDASCYFANITYSGSIYAISIRNGNIILAESPLPDFDPAKTYALTLSFDDNKITFQIDDPATATTVESIEVNDSSIPVSGKIAFYGYNGNATAYAEKYFDDFKIEMYQ